MTSTQFVDNRADAAGAAVMLQTFAYVQNRLERSYYNFSDWYIFVQSTRTNYPY